jgi:hypothetical protein
MSWADVGRSAFLELESRFRVHIKQILTLDEKPPMHAATLLILVAYEAIGRLFDRGRGEELFAQELQVRRGVPFEVGESLYLARRNGLAHSYRTHRIVLGKGGVRPRLAWKAGPHLKITSVEAESIHDRLAAAAQKPGAHQRVCIVVSELWKDLDALFQDLEATLQADPKLAARIEARATILLHAEERKSRPEGRTLTAWRRYVDENTWDGRQ